MKLIFPFVGEVEAADARLMRLAEFSGVPCEPLSLERLDQGLEDALAGQSGCLVINPRVMKEWTGGSLPQGFGSSLTSRFPFLLVHGLTPDSFCRDLTKALSGDRLQSVQAVADRGGLYEIASDMREICGSFSGISFGPVNPLNDHVFLLSTDAAAVRKPISIGGKPFMATMKQEKSEVVFLAGVDTLDIHAEIGDKPLSEYFSLFVPHVMALRYIFGEQCWHPHGHYAALIIDDPLLRAKYGYLDFETLLGLMKEQNFSTTVAFIPRNYRRNSKQTVQLFRENSDRLAICFHGNDHTAGEFASTHIPKLNTMVRIAEERMRTHTNSSGLGCSKVMVFPQEKFSVEAVKVLKSRNFFAAVNASPSPAGRRVMPTLEELAQPAILRYEEFPLFIRKYIGETRRQDVAFNLFFGKPALLVEHHGVFGRPEPLIEAVRMVNSIAPETRWCDLDTAVMNSTLRRTSPDGVCHVRAFSGTVRIANDRNSSRRFVVEWSHRGGRASVDQVLQSGADRSFEVDNSAIRVSMEVAPHASETLSVVYRNDCPSLEGLGFRWGAKAFLRRRLSEARDNYISKNQFAMTIAQALRRRVLSKIL